MKAFHLSQQWDAKLGFDLACYKVELGSFDFFSYQCWEYLIIFTFSMVLSFFLFLSFHHGWYEDEKGNLFCSSKSHHFYFLVFTGLKLLFKRAVFAFLLVSKNKAIDDFRNFWIIVFSTVWTKIMEHMNCRICLIFTSVSQNAKIDV